MYKTLISKVANKLGAYKRNLQYRLWFSSAEGQQHAAALKALKNKYANKRCFILGNGPSLLSTDLSPLKNEITFGSNRNYLMWDEMGFEPTFFTVEDSKVAENWTSEINNLEGVFKIYPKDLSGMLTVETGKGVYIDFIRTPKKFPSFSFDALKGIFWGGTVTVMNMQLACHMGFTEIYLLGIDHNYSVTSRTAGSNLLTVEQLGNENYAHPGYMEKNKPMYAPNSERMELGYQAAKRALNQTGIKVFNATNGGKLEVFERRRFQDLFKE